ncbi:MAG: glutathione S-transferase N-terminal domain-containing protein [Pseudomonadales bacterium]
MNALIDLAGSLATTALRAGMGTMASPAAHRPTWLFELYEFEGCPYCRLVREALTELDLDALIYPCPKDGTRYRPRAAELGGKMQFPFFVDPGAGVQLYESADIVRYLFETYGGRDLPWHWRATALQQAGSAIAGLPRAWAGVRVAPSQPPQQPLELYSFEASPFARLVRERLCELEIAYVLRSVGRSSPGDWVVPAVREAMRWTYEPETVNRKALLARAGRVSIPYLVDPNTGVEMAESADILAYLDRYRAAAS